MDIEPVRAALSPEERAILADVARQPRGLRRVVDPQADRPILGRLVDLGLVTEHPGGWHHEMTPAGWGAYGYRAVRIKKPSADGAWFDAYVGGSVPVTDYVGGHAGFWTVTVEGRPEILGEEYGEEIFEPYEPEQ